MNLPPYQLLTSWLHRDLEVRTSYSHNKTSCSNKKLKLHYQMQLKLYAFSILR